MFLVYAKGSYFLMDFWPFLLLDFVFFPFLLFAIVRIVKSQIGERKKKAFLMAVTFFCFSVFIFTGFEAFFRYRFDESDSLGFLKISERWFKRHVVYNSYFYRDRDFTREKKPGVTRIGIVGDSMTFGYGIKNTEDRFSSILEKKLRGSGRNVEVYNLGKSGYDTWNEIDEFRKVKDMHFDIVVWQYFLNDAQPKASTGTKVLIRQQKQSDLAREITSKSFFLDYLYWRLEAKYDEAFLELRQVDIDSYRDTKNFARHKNDVETFSKILKEDNRKAIVLLLPFFKFLPDNPLSDKYDEIKKMFTGNGLEVIDVYPAVKKMHASDVVVSRYDYHPNEKIQVIIADLLYAKLAPVIPASMKK
ncbi:MAG: SGNH/GDSL hydrolase family protein [Candidatus Levybacteria bacterium]|nr:SGNH/GDSL hydrolase family protein [Candidatus Levybacteria bacterium]